MKDYTFQVINLKNVSDKEYIALNKIINMIRKERQVEEMNITPVQLVESCHAG